MAGGGGVVVVVVVLGTVVGMVAFGFGQIFYGPAGDRFGRRPVILGGLAVYVVATAGCAFAAAAGHLIALRCLQGLAACGGVVLARTMVRDLAERNEGGQPRKLRDRLD